MASMKDAVEEAIQDSNSIFKYIIFAIPLFLVVNFSKEQIPGYTFWVVLTAILLLGFMLHCTSNVRAGNSYVLPSFNVFSIIWVGLKGVLALAPVGLVSYFLPKFIIEQITAYIPDSNVLLVITCIIYGIFASLVLTAYLLYAAKFKILDAYNVKAISTYSIDVLIAVIFMIVQAAIVDVILIAPTSYVIWLFFGIPHPVAIYVWSVILMYNLAFLGHYLAQVSYEVIEVKEEANRD